MSETASASGEDTFDKPATQVNVEDTTARTNLFEKLADTHKLDPQTVRALTMDFLATLTTNSGTLSPASAPETPVHVHTELPTAVFSS